MSQHARGYLFVTLAATMWGIAGAISKYLFSERAIHPFLLVQVRMGLSFLLLAAILAVTAPHLLRIGRKDLNFLTVWGILGMAAVQFAYLMTISETNVATAIFLQYLAPILTALWAWLAERQQLGLAVVICLSLAMAGSVLLIFGGTAQLLISPLGLTTGLASAVFMAFYTIYGARGVGRLSPWTVLCYGLGTGTAFWLLLDILLIGTGRTAFPVEAFTSGSLWLFFLYIATLATIIPFGLYLTGLKTVAPTLATVTGMLEPVVAGISSYLLLGERLRAAQVAGGGLIVGAVILLQVFNARRRISD